MSRTILLNTLGRWARTTHVPRRPLAARRFTVAIWLLAGVAVVDAGSGPSEDRSGDIWATLAALVEHGPAPLPAGDEDADGLPDALEERLAREYAPIVVLDGRDGTRPASIPWLLARADLTTPFPEPARRGSDDPADWTTYTHVYPRADGGTNIQYWFFYPYNDGPSFFDHEGDWEHVTVRIGRDGAPRGVYLAHHKEDNPGTYRAWARMQREGDHPIVVSARGTHATYASAGVAPWFERSSACSDLARCDGPVWRTWEGGGLADLGERARPRILPEAIGYAGTWGAERWFPGTSAPVGPTHHRGFCHAGFTSCDATSAPERSDPLADR